MFQLSFVQYTANKCLSRVFQTICEHIMTKMVQNRVHMQGFWKQPPLMPISRMANEYHHEFTRNMNITLDKTTMLICPCSGLLKTNSLVTPSPAYQRIKIFLIVFGVTCICLIGGQLTHLPVYHILMSINSGPVSYQSTCVLHDFLKQTLPKQIHVH